MKTTAAGLDMTYITWKERQTISSLLEKALSLKSEKYCSAKIGCLDVQILI